MGKRRGQTLPEAEKKPLNKEGFKKLAGIFRYMMPYKWAFLAGMVFLFVSSVSVLGFPYLSGELVDVTEEDIGRLNTVGGYFIGVLVIQAIASYFRVYLFSYVSENSMANLRSDLYQRLMTLPLSFYDERRAGEIISRITSDVSALQMTFSTTLAEFFRQIITLIGGIILLLLISTKLTLFMLATFPVMIIITLVFGRFIRKLAKKTQDTLADSNVIVEETLQSIQVIKSFTTELFEINRYRNKQNEVVMVAMKNAKYRAGFISFIVFALFGGIVGVMYYGGRMVQLNEISIGELVKFVLITLFVGGSMAGLGDIMGQIQRAIGSSEKVLEIIHLTPEFKASLADKPSLKLQGGINFRNVHFTYPTRPDVTVLSGIDLRIAPGEKVALVGHSGAGKSTIIQLLQHFYNLNEGEIIVDGRNITEYPVWEYRQHFGLVPQEVILFGGTIRENIGYGKPDASEDEIRAAAAKANALSFIESFPEGLDTVVGDRGIKLSGGQRQRVAIARAILKDPTILILDEATSSLDAESEAQVQEALDELMKGRTTIVIAHRLATIRKVDRIYVLDQGRIIESGTHEELLGSGEGTYSNLVKLQLQEE
ncbi:ABC transporter ATP-binding protein [Roseivirga sp. BDSF3-8]|uniref:ABC transporter ATP-binding protein n=1 Tax=Roseivirga sp. BDSF3-8 TaxID=3241598 RepID=UPI0035321C18